MMPKYPVYVISKGRAATPYTARFLAEDGVPFYLVVEPQEKDEYEALGLGQVITTPFANLGLGSIPVRNFVKEHAKAGEHERHWLLDDNIRHVNRIYKGRTIRCPSGHAFACVEEFVDRYVNVGLAGLTYDMFGSFPGLAPFKVNVHVYSCILVNSTMPYVWRGRYNEDTDLCLQVISGGLCTVLVQVFTCEKIKTMTVAGGNTAELYKGHGRLAMARSLERVWPYVVKVVRRYGRPAHYVKWEKFTTALVPRPGFDPTKLPAIDEHGLELVQVKDTKDTGWS